MQDPILTYPSQPGSTKKNYTGLIIIIIIAALAGGWLLSRQSQKTDQTKVTTTETITPTPTVNPEIDKKSVKIQVLNGTGTPGQAGIAVELLKDAGYSADNIKTANAAEFDNTVTAIAAKDGFDNVAKDVEDALKETFEEVNIDSTPLDKDSEFDIVVTTGGKIFEEATPTPTESPTPTTETTTTPTPTLTSIPTPTPIP